MHFDPEILRRYFSGNYSRNDYRKIRAMFADQSGHSILRKYLDEHWSEYHEPGGAGNVNDPDGLLDRIHYRIYQEEKGKSGINFMIIFQRLAAILIIPLTLAFFALLYMQKESDDTATAYAEIQCPLGVRTKFVLPDGTTGFLNSGSRLKYPVVFQSEREVVIHGEAYFHVREDKLRSFVVSTGNMEISVLGTCFNVVAYGDECKEEVILNEGSVEVSLPGQEPFAILTPDQKLSFDTETRSYTKTDVEAVQYVGWTEGKLVFRNEHMQLVAERMGRWYNADIEIADEELLKYAFRATFIDEPLGEVLKLLSFTAPLLWEEEPRKTSDDHTFQKRKITVRLDKKRINAF